MIYECPNCQTPQEAGQTICPRCHAQFDGPVPDDAIIPAGDLTAVADAAPTESAQESVPEDTMPLAGTALAEAAPLVEVPLVEVPPPAPEAASAPNAQPHPTAQAYTPPAAQDYAPPYEAPPEPVPSAPPFGGLSRVLMVAFPIVLVLVLGGVFYTNSLNSDADTTPVPAVAPVHSSVSAAPLPAAPVTSPTYLQGGGNTNNPADDPRAKLLAGRWESKSGDYYVFNSDGTGSRGNLVKQQPEQAFLWGLVQNRVMLYMDKNQMLRFNAGPDDDTIFLAGATGGYIQFSRSKTT